MSSDESTELTTNSQFNRYSITKKIALICVYYGRLPKYFNFFSQSCYNNPGVDFYIITDLQKPANTDKLNNLFFYNLSIDNFIKKAEETFDIKIPNIISKYKICDFKPAFGVIFKELLMKYDYWGHIDIDQVIGDLSIFINDIILDKYELISFRKEFVYGPLSLFRNEEKINNLFKKSKDYPRIYTELLSCTSFDEATGKQYHLLRNKMLTATNYLPDWKGIDCMTSIVERDVMNNNLSYLNVSLSKDDVILGEILTIDKGKITDNFGNNYINYHFIYSKKIKLFHFPQWQEQQPLFFVTCVGIFKQFKGFGFIFNNVSLAFIELIRYKVLPHFERFVIYFKKVKNRINN